MFNPLPPIWHERLDSTNSELRRLLQNDPAPPSGYVLAAHEQTAGRGRLQRPWSSRPGRDLCFSCLLTPPVHRQASPVSLPMAVALAVSDALAPILSPHHKKPTLKWPNDILIDQKKCCGVLCEQASISRDSAPQIYHYIIGVGLNVNMSAAEAETIDRPATSLAIETGARRPLPPLLEQILTTFPQRLGQWEQGGFPALRPDFESRALPVGAPICVTDGQNKINGRIERYGEMGQLFLRDNANNIKEIWSGDLDFPK